MKIGSERVWRQPLTQCRNSFAEPEACSTVTYIKQDSAFLRFSNKRSYSSAIIHNRHTLRHFFVRVGDDISGTHALQLILQRILGQVTFDQQRYSCCFRSLKRTVKGRPFTSFIVSDLDTDDR